MFASDAVFPPGLATLLFIGVVCYGAYRAYVFLFRPEQLAEERRMKHEKEMEERKPNAGSAAGKILGGIAKIVIGAAIKGKPHH